MRNERFCLDEVFYLLVMDEAARFMGFTYSLRLCRIMKENCWNFVVRVDGVKSQYVPGRKKLAVAFGRCFAFPVRRR